MGIEEKISVKREVLFGIAEVFLIQIVLQVFNVPSILDSGVLIWLSVLIFPVINISRKRMLRATGNFVGFLFFVAFMLYLLVTAGP